MAYTAHPEPTRPALSTAWHVTGAVAGVAGAAMGALLAYGPADGTITMFDWTRNVSDLSEMWGPFLMMGGGLIAVLCIGFILVWDGEATTWLEALEMSVGVVGISALLVGIALLLI